MSAEYTAALIGALGTIAAAFVGVLTWYLTSRADRRHERDAAKPHGATKLTCANSACSTWSLPFMPKFSPAFSPIAGN